MKKAGIFLIVILILAITIFFFLGNPKSQEELKEELLQKIEKASVPEKYGLEYYSSPGFYRANVYDTYRYSIQEGNILSFTSKIERDGTANQFVCIQTTSTKQSSCVCENLDNDSVESCGDREINPEEVLRIEDLIERISQNVSEWKNLTKSKVQREQIKENHNFELIETKGDCYLDERDSYFGEVCFDGTRVTSYIEEYGGIFGTRYSIWREIPLPIQELTRE